MAIIFLIFALTYSVNMYFIVTIIIIVTIKDKYYDQKIYYKYR